MFIGNIAATDLHHSFVQRWNEASGHREKGGHWPSIEIANNLPFPNRLSGVAGDATVQVQRSIQANRYTDGHPSVGTSVPFNISLGEASIYEQVTSRR